MCMTLMYLIRFVSVSPQLSENPFPNWACRYFCPVSSFASFISVGVNYRWAGRHIYPVHLTLLSIILKLLLFLPVFLIPIDRHVGRSVFLDFSPKWLKSCSFECQERKMKNALPLNNNSCLPSHQAASLNMQILSPLVTPNWQLKKGAVFSYLSHFGKCNGITEVLWCFPFQCSKITDIDCCSSFAAGLKSNIAWP